MPTEHSEPGATGAPRPSAAFRTVAAITDHPLLAVILLHGRGGSADDILSLVDVLAQPSALYIAPQAETGTWYPYSFLAPIEYNEPQLSAALSTVGEAVEVAAAAGIPVERTVIMGFSQGGCLGLEYAARHAKRYGGLVAFSGGLIGSGDGTGAPPEDKLFEYEGSLDGTPVFIGCGDRDPHIPVARVRRSTAVLTALGGAVTERIYPGHTHSINTDEIRMAQKLLQDVAEGEFDG